MCRVHIRCGKSGHTAQHTHTWLGAACCIASSVEQYHSWQNYNHFSKPNDEQEKSHRSINFNRIKLMDSFVRCFFFFFYLMLWSVRFTTHGNERWTCSTCWSWPRDINCRFVFALLYWICNFFFLIYCFSHLYRSIMGARQLTTVAKIVRAADDDRCLVPDARCTRTTVNRLHLKHSVCALFRSSLLGHSEQWAVTANGWR